MTELATNVLYYGDNLDILRRYLPDASVDLIYLDPPFNSNRDYNVIFQGRVRQPDRCPAPRSGDHLS
jgi:16S rRNA G966 N2-methylase RsmD